LTFVEPDIIRPRIISNAHLSRFGTLEDSRFSAFLSCLPVLLLLMFSQRLETFDCLAASRDGQLRRQIISHLGVGLDVNDIGIESPERISDSGSTIESSRVGFDGWHQCFRGNVKREFGGSLNDHEKSVPFLYMIIQEKNRSSFLKIGKNIIFLLEEQQFLLKAGGFFAELG